MTSRKRAVLARLVEHHETAGRPLSKHYLAETVNTTPETVGEVLTELEEIDLVVRTDTGYRPTITGQQLLNLELPQDGVVVVDVVEDGTDTTHRE